MKKIYIFTIIALFVYFLKLTIAILGYNNDMEIWKYVSEGMLEGFTKGRSVYTYTQFYNHGPIRSYVLYFVAMFLNKFSLHDMFSFHVVIVSFLALADTITSLLLWKIYDWKIALIFLLNPVSLLITGYHSQISGTVVMFGLISWFLYLQAIKYYKGQNSSYKKLFYLSALILGFSTGIKHIFFFFPVYLFLLHRKQKLFSLKEMTLYIAIVYFIFFGLFGIEILRDSYHPAAITFRNIKMFVFDYRAGGLYGNSGFAQLLQLFLPHQYILKLFSFLPILKDYTLFFVGGIITYGVLTISKIKDVKYLFPLYLLAMFVFSPSIANQYLAVPLVAMAVFYKNLIPLIYFLVSYLHLAAVSGANIASLVRYQMSLSIFNLKIPYYPWNQGVVISDTHSQMWAFLLAIILLLQIYGFSFKDEFKKIIRDYLP
ncbi:hypothetical protein HYV31_01990 [candidate division WWE3 bacterium]|nr:hypothetical protein [candidate division WWE3 bacterium]